MAQSFSTIKIGIFVFCFVELAIVQQNCLKNEKKNHLRMSAPPTIIKAVYFAFVTDINYFVRPNDGRCYEFVFE